MTDARALLFGSHGSERPVVWGGAGFGLALAALFLAGEFLAADAAHWIALAAAVLGTLGALGHALDEGGILGCIAVVWGPLAGTFLVVLDPLYYPVVEPVAAALAAAIALGLGGYLVGRALISVRDTWLARTEKGSEPADRTPEDA